MNLAKPGDPLSFLEEEILPYVAEGMSNGEIGLQVGRKPDAIKARLEKMFTKTDTRSRCALVAWGFRNGMLK